MQLRFRLVELFCSPQDYFNKLFDLGLKFIRKSEQLKAARYFMYAGKRMNKQGYKGLTEEAFDRARKAYKKAIDSDPSVLKAKDYRDLGTLDIFFNPFPQEGWYEEDDTWKIKKKLFPPKNVL